MLRESIPYGLPILGKLMIALAPGSVERVSCNVKRMSQDGYRMMEVMGGREAYDSMTRAKRVKRPMVNVENRSQIVFD